MPRTTPLIDLHRARGARLVDFAGWLMPIQYTGIMDEHARVRQAVGLFDVSHMGRVEVRGSGARGFLDNVVTNGVAALPEGKALYSPLCRPDGGILDDLLVYAFPDHFLVIVNAANADKDFAWLEKNRPGDVTLVDRTDETALIAIQGRRAEDVAALVLGDVVRTLDYYACAPARGVGVDVLVGRTGYTGEDGYEIVVPAAEATTMWEALEEAGAAVGVETSPAGLGARDTLRLEMGYCLYGNDIDETTTPVEAGLGWTVKWDKPAFIGRDALLAEKASGPARKLVGFLAGDARAIPRHGAIVRDGAGDVGIVTSGTFAPSIGRALGMAYVRADRAKIGTALTADVRGSAVQLQVVKRPFYTNGSHK